MPYVKKLKIKGKEYWYMFHTVRDGSKFRKISKYLGKILPENIEQIKENFLKEIKKPKIEDKIDNTTKLIESLTPLERKVLPVLKENKELNEIIEKTGLQEVEVMRALQWLENKNIINVKKDLQEVISLDNNGKKYLKEGLPERKFLQSLTSELSLGEIKNKANLNDDELTISLGQLKKKAAITFVDKKVKITEQGKKLLKKESLEEQFLKKLPLDVSKLEPEEKFAYESLKKRKRIIKTNLIKIRTVKLEKLGEELSSKNLKTELVESLTPEIISKNNWDKKTFRRYDIKINVPKIYGGKRHFVNQALDYARNIWLEMGFKEMTGSIVQTSFWNFDALYTPQDHSVREMQDTFFIENPEKGQLPKKELMDRIKRMHENGGSIGSTGWRYPWNSEEARKNVIRTHTTVLSAQTLAEIKKTELPVKFFGIGKCFRNETVDWSHLFEFNQTEGIVVDEDANLRHLIGYLKQFFKKMGFPEARFRPAYFPYTEPSLEIDVYHPVHKKWIELGGAGIFRPEVVIPLLGKDIPVLAWGPGIDRIVMDYYKIKDLRMLYKNDIKQLREIKTWWK
ncbi:phenylalanine--tRNA ligase subunit alpha [archaeon]|nr:phenylalanine--tRNA ligase subunit alpha [archaeon]